MIIAICCVNGACLQELTYKKLPKLYKHLQTQQCEMSIIATDWFLCLFATTLPSEVVLYLVMPSRAGTNMPWVCFVTHLVAPCIDQSAMQVRMHLTASTLSALNGACHMFVTVTYAHAILP